MLHFELPGATSVVPAWSIIHIALWLTLGCSLLNYLST